MSDWDSRQYLRFEKERTQPARDLAARLTVRNPKKIVDIGCGPGNSTQVLAEKYPDARVIGADSSLAMIETARKDHPELEFTLCDANRDLSSLGEDFDIVFSNACIQWIPDHEKLIPNMLALLKKGGELAVQTPYNFTEPVHIITDQIAASNKWKECICFGREFYNLTPGGYFDLLLGIATEFDIWEVAYYHRMRTHRDILDWYRSTGLRPYLNVLPEDKKEAFERDFLAEIKKEYTVQRSDDILFKFPRLFFMAVK